MSTETLLMVLIGAVAALAVIGLIVGVANRSMRSQKLRRKFGSEYDYAIEKTGDRRAAEEMLEEREKRATEFEIHELSEDERERFYGEWLGIQSDFVDNPSKSIAEADRLITEVMNARGFPLTDFEQRSADLSVFYPSFISDYRHAHAIATDNEHNESSTEELRQAMIHYRSLFDELLGARESRKITSEEKELVSK